jgi:hypothetical protein
LLMGLLAASFFVLQRLWIFNSRNTRALSSLSS